MAGSAIFSPLSACARLSERWRVMMRPLSAKSFSLGFATVLLATNGAQAQTDNITGGNQATTMLTNICSFILGPFGQTLAVLGIIAIGLCWMFGRASLTMVAGIIGGIIIMFAASWLGATLVAS